MQNDLKKTVAPALELMDTAKQAVVYCHNKILSGNIDDAFYDMINNVYHTVTAVKEYIEPNLQEIRPNAIIPLCNNILYSIETFTQMDYSELLYPQFTFENEIEAAVRGLYEALEFSFIIWPDGERCAEFYDDRDRLCVKARSLNVTKELNKIHNKYEVTIVVMTYNLLEYFKQCLESLLKYTNFEEDKVQIIVFNHGSSDGTSEYLKEFSHLDYFKVHNCRENIKNELTFVTKNCTWYDTKYTMIIANDTIATENYLKNLLTCIKSDDRIAWICPSMSNTSNNQGIPVKYDTIEEMHEFASKHNKSDPTKWVELSRLIPVFSMYNNVCRKAIDHEDPSYYEFFYGDDDISRMLIRSKFRILVCKDTYIHHYPSMTVHQGPEVGQRYYDMRKIFFQKYGYDAWKFQVAYRFFLDKIPLPRENPSKILFIEPERGEAVQELRTRLHANGIPLEKVEVHSAGTKLIFHLDMQGYSDKSNIISKYEQLLEIYKNDTFDQIILPEFIDKLDIPDYGRLLKLINKLLKKGGQFYCAFNNYYYLGNIFEMLSLTTLEPNDEFSDRIGKSVQLIKKDDFTKAIQNLGIHNIQYLNVVDSKENLETKYQQSLIANLQEKLGIITSDQINDVICYAATIIK